MVSRARRSVLWKVPAAVGALVVSTALASAQHPVVPAARPPATPVHVAPPIYHAPLIQPPIVRAPVVYAPISTPSRNAIVPPGGVLGTPIILPPVRPVRPTRPIRTFPPLVLVYNPPFILGEPFSQFNLCWWTGCDLFWPWSFGSFTVSSPGPLKNYVSQASETPVLVYGAEREDFPQLYLKDGTVLNVTDYWVVDNQLHFTLIEETGTKPVEHSIPFEELDLQKSVDANTQRGFRFILRNEPFEQYVRDHPEGPPPLVTPPHQ